jgi:pimeloyl-ACP methyl ester carboxylesterase
MSGIDWSSDAMGNGQYAEVNGINLYYETHGSGRPMVLLHGGLGSGEMFGPVLPALAANHQVIVVDLQGHGRTADIDRPLDVRLMADDIAALIDHLGLDRPDVVGYSLGGGVALHTAAKYPAKVGRLVVASANIRPEAIYPEMREQQAQVGAAAAEFMRTPRCTSSTSGSPRGRRTSPGCWTRSGRRWRSRSTSPTRSAGSRCRRSSSPPTPTWRRRATTSRSSACSTVGSATVAGWARAGPREGTRLAILPGLTHYNVSGSPLFAATTLAFLDAPTA